MVAFSTRMISHSVIVTADAIRRNCPVTFAEEFVRSRHCDDGFLAFLGDNDDFDLAILDVEHRIRRIALREERFALFVL